MTLFRSLWWMFATLLQRLAMALVVVGAFALVGVTLGAALGLLPWLSLPMSFGDAVPIDGGLYVQIGVTALFVGLAAYLPANARIVALETSHRRFHITMDDVARAYALCHSADRTGVFRLKSEFDSVRERIAFLRDHPDLSELEPSVLEIAAQMSHVSRDLADVYSDEAVARARDFIDQRYQEVERFNRRLDEAKAVAADIRLANDRLELDEDVARSQISRLETELRSLLPEMFTKKAQKADAQPDLFSAAQDTIGSNVTPLPQKAAE